MNRMIAKLRDTEYFRVSPIYLPSLFPSALHNCAYSDAQFVACHYRLEATWC